MADKPEVALDTLLWTLAMQEFYHGTNDQFVAQISVSGHFQGEKSLEQTTAAKQFANIRRRQIALLPKEGSDLWQWLRTEASAFVKSDLLAYLVATSLNAVQVAGNPAKRHSDQLHASLGLDMADWWKPTGGNYLGRVPRDKVLEALTEAGETPENMVAFRAMKKAPLIEKAEKALAETRWLPTPLRVPEPELRTLANRGRGKGGGGLILPGGMVLAVPPRASPPAGPGPATTRPFRLGLIHSGDAKHPRNRRR